MYKVLIADKLSEEAVKIFKDNEIETVVKTGLSEEDLSVDVEILPALDLKKLFNESEVFFNF